MSKPYKSKIRECQYEIMLVVDGDLSVEDARNSISGLLSLFSNSKDYKDTVLPSQTLAYPMRGKSIAHRFILNFSLEDTSLLAEFNRLSLLNKCLLRSLVLNLTKDKSFRAKNNPKKVKDYEIRQEKRRQYVENKKNLNGTFVISNAS